MLEFARSSQVILDVTGHSSNSHENSDCHRVIARIGRNTPWLAGLGGEDVVTRAFRSAKKVASPRRAWCHSREELPRNRPTFRFRRIVSRKGSPIAGHARVPVERSTPLATEIETSLRGTAGNVLGARFEVTSDLARDYSNRLAVSISSSTLFHLTTLPVIRFGPSAAFSFGRQPTRFAGEASPFRSFKSDRPLLVVLVCDCVALTSLKGGWKSKARRWRPDDDTLVM